MDQYPQDPAQHNKWYDMADAMNAVADLADNDKYRDFMKNNALVTKTRWQAATDKPVCVEASENELFNFLPDGNGGHFVIGEFDAQLIETGDTRELTITFLANDYSMKISGHNGELFLQYYSDDQIPPVSVDEEGVVQLIFKVAEFQPGQEYIPEQYRVNLENLLFGMGNVSGKSSRSTLTGVCDANSAFVARLTEQETPDASGVSHDIQSAEVVGEGEFAMTNESLLQIVNSNNPDALEDEYRPKELAASGLGVESSTSKIFVSELQRANLALSGLKGFDYYRSRGSYKEARQYAAICQDFLRTLDKLTGVRP